MTIKSDVVIVGAGPSGLFQVFELGLLGIQAHVVDSLPNVGGQCTALYPDKPIYDIPALPVCGAQELVDRLVKQIEPFAPTFHLKQEVVELRLEETGRYHLRTKTGTEFSTAAVVIAGGLGAFVPRPLRLPGIDKHNDLNLHYKVNDRHQFEHSRLVILGGGDSALDWALDLRKVAQAVTVIHRRNEFRGAPASVQKLRFLANDPTSNVDLKIAKVVDYDESLGRLCALDVEDEHGKTSVFFDDLLVCYGLSPNLGPVAKWGLTIERRQLVVDTEKFETNLPGVHAIGDINTYPGKKKLILSGFHEAALTAFAIRARLNPEEKVTLQYTTTSKRLHERLGLRDAV